MLLSKICHSGYIHKLRFNDNGRPERDIPESLHTFYGPLKDIEKSSNFFKSCNINMDE